MAERPILFNTEMVKAIIAGRKTQTRRLCKGQPQDGVISPEAMGYKPPYHAGDILWVRETWKQATTGTAGPGLIDLFLYRADEPQDTTGMMVEDCWHPSIHMPRRAARLFLRVISVRTQRLQDISEEDVCAEGAEKIITSCEHMDWSVTPPEPCFNTNPCHDCIIDQSYPESFGRMVWNNTIKSSDIPLYGWDANPWVWVIEFERLEKSPWKN